MSCLPNSRRRFNMALGLKLILATACTSLFFLGMASRSGERGSSQSLIYREKGRRGGLMDRLWPERKPYVPIVTSTDTVETVVTRAKTIYALGKPVLVNVFNSGFLEMTLNWLCHTEPMNIHQHVLLVTLDLNTTNAIRQAGFLQVTIVTLLDQAGSTVDGAMAYGKVGYHRLLYARSRVLVSLLEADVELIQFESDATWFVDPYPFTMYFTRLNNTLADLVALTCSDRPYLIATGYMYLRPTPPILALFSQLDEKLRVGVEAHRGKKNKDRSLDKGLYDQPLLSKLYKDFRNQITYRVVPWYIAPDGRWYDKPEAQNSTNPLMLSNNWTVGNTRKKDRAQRFGHWFLDDNAVCNRRLASSFAEDSLRRCRGFCH